jgi:hypothetical protein
MRKTTAPTHALRAVFTGIGQAFMAADRVKERITEEPDAPDAASAADEPGPAAPPSSGADGGLAVRLLDQDGTERPRSQATGTAGTTPAHGRAGGRAARSPRPRRGAAEPAEPRWRSLDQTGNVRLLSAEDLLDELPPLPPADEARHAARVAGYAAAPVTAPDEPLTAGYSYGNGHREADGTAAELTATATMTELAADHEPAGHELDEPRLPVPGYDLLSVASLRARLRNLDVDQVRVLAAYERAHAARPDVVTMFERRVAKLTEDE